MHLAGRTDSPTEFKVIFRHDAGSTLCARAALAASGTLPENVNYAVKIGRDAFHPRPILFKKGVWDAVESVPTILESVPEVSAKLKEANTKEIKFEDVVKAAEQAAVLVLVY